MGMSSSVFQRFILASRLFKGRGPVLEVFDLELLLRTMVQKSRKRSVVHSGAGKNWHYVSNYIIELLHVHVTTIWAFGPRSALQVFRDLSQRVRLAAR